MATEEITIPVTGPVWARSSRHAIVDLGADDQCGRRAETLIALGLPRSRNFTPWLQGRLVARVPLADLPLLVAAGAPITEGSTYYRTTHHWTGLADGETVVAAECAAYDRLETDDREAKRTAVGSNIFTTWKWLDASYVALSKHLGGIRRYGVSVPIPVAEIARVYGIGRETSRFADRCPHWQRPDILRIFRQVAIEAAERVAPLHAGMPQSDVAHDVIAMARAAGTRTDLRNPVPRSSEVDAMWRQDARSLAAYHAQAAAVSLANQWMRTGVHDQGTDMIWPATAVCHQARRAAGMAAVIGHDLPPIRETGAYATGKWEEDVRRMTAYADADRRERDLQVDRLVELSTHPVPTTH